MNKQLTPAKLRQVERLLATGMQHKAVAKRCRIHGTTVGQIARGQHTSQRVDRRSGYCPTPEEIETACEAIRRNRQHVAAPEPLEFPIVSARLLFGDL